MASTAKRQLDLGSALGLVIGFGAILGGHLIEGGTLKQVRGGAAAIIVLGGCLGATLLATPLPVFREAISRIPQLFFRPGNDYAELIESVVGFSTKARKNGIVSLEAEAASLSDPFLRKSLMLAVDGVDTSEIRSTMELEIQVEEDRTERVAKVFDAAGGFAPTIGIIGAVLGLILVMEKMNDIEAVAHGIAAAFVATIYGVGSANLIFLPAGQKLRMRGESERERRELLLEGVLGLAEGLNPKLIRGKLEAYLGAAPASPRKSRATAPQRAPVEA
jgi:chemotaxis protein MotA